MITLRDVTLRRGTKVVLDRASATLNPGEKVGLVGRNGSPTAHREAETAKAHRG